MRAESVGRQPSAARLLLRRCVTGLRRIAGMPNYQAYVQHLRARHPTLPIPSEREFFDRFLAARHGQGVSRCC